MYRRTAKYAKRREWHPRLVLRAERIEALAEANRQRERAERAESALAELMAKVKSAPVGVYAATTADHGVVHTHRWIAADLIGKRVLLLLDDGEIA